MKKGLKIFGVILGVIVLLALVFFSIDNYRISKQEKPIFCIKNPAGLTNDGGTIEYFGLGYKVIDFHTLAGFDDIKIGTWAMKYEDFEDEMNKYQIRIEENNNDINYSKTIDGVTIELNIPNDWYYEEIEESENASAKFELKMYKSSKEKSASLYFYKHIFAVCGTGLESEELTLDNGFKANVGYYDGSKVWSFIGFYESNPNIAIWNNGLEEKEGKELLEIAKTIVIDNNEKDTSSFYGKVIESNEKYIIVEPNENEEIRKSADKISVGLEENNDALYKVGTNVKITYDGEIMETYPAQIKARNIELISVEKFKEDSIVEIEYMDEDFNSQKISITSIEDIKLLKEIFVNAKYDREPCEGIITHTIVFNNKDKYYLLEGCKEISRNGKQSLISDENINKIKSIISSKVKDDNEETKIIETF